MNQEKLLFALVVGALVTALVVFGFGKQAISDNCSALVCVRGTNGNGGADCLERDYAPLCVKNSELPSCLPNNVPVYGGSTTNPQYGTFAPPAPLCLAPYNLAVSGSVPEPRLRPKCPSGQDALSCVVGCVPSSGVFACSALAGEQPIQIYGQVTPTPSAQPTDAIPSSALPTPSPVALPLSSLNTPSSVANGFSFAQVFLVWLASSAGAFFFLNKRG